MIMESKKETMGICRFCLKHTNKFIIIDSITREIVQLLVLKLDLTLTDEPVMCYDCANIIQKVFDFKSTCIGTDDSLLPFNETKNSTKLDLNEIYCKINETENVDNHLVCRFCMELDKEDFCMPVNCLVKNVEMKILLQKYFPEMVMEHIENPVICHNCLALLQVFSLFIKRHLDSEVLIKSCMTGTENKQIDLGEVKNMLQVLRKPSSIVSDISDVSKCNLSILSANGDVSNNDKIVIKIEEVPYETMEACVLQGLEKIDFPEKNATDNKNDSAVKTETGNDNDWTSVHVDVQKKVTDIIDVPKRKKFRCKKCPFKCRGKKRYKKHLATHKEGPQPLKCPACPFKTILQRNLNLHMMRHKDPMELGMLKCEKCEYQTRCQRNLMVHVYNIHERKRQINKVFRCILCSFISNCMAVHYQHIYSHKTVSGMLKCPVCDYETNTVRDIKGHMQKHKSREKCDMCPYTCFGEMRLSKHTANHICAWDPTKFKCSKCDYCSKDKSNLLQHCFDQHIWYQCSHCPYNSSEKYRVSYHELKHNSDKALYKCEVCPTKLKHKESFKRHMARHRRGNEISDVTFNNLII